MLIDQSADVMMLCIAYQHRAKNAHSITRTVARHGKPTGRSELMDCDKCLWATRSGGCASWKCDPIDKREAYTAWKENHEKEQKQ